MLIFLIINYEFWLWHKLVFSWYLFLVFSVSLDLYYERLVYKNSNLWGLPKYNKCTKPYFTCFTLFIKTKWLYLKSFVYRLRILFKNSRLFLCGGSYWSYVFSANIVITSRMSSIHRRRGPLFLYKKIR